MLGEVGVGRSLGGNFRHWDPGQLLRVPVNRFAHTGVRLGISNLGCLRLLPMVEQVTTLAGVHAVLPPHRYTQAELTAAFTEMCLGPDGNQALLARLHANAKVSSRHLVLPLEQYATLTGFGESNDLFIAHAVQLGAAALTGALQRAGIAPDEVDVVISTTITGIAVPSIEARIAHLVGLRPDVKRMPLFGLGCVAGAAGIARLHDYLIGHPDQVGALLSVELCSLTHFRQGAFGRVLF